MINGVINIYKEKGFTSHDVVAKLRGILHQKKIGHTGTLDPDAEGVLLVCLGRGTKVCDMLTNRDKVYEAVMLLGTTTDTQDTSGKVLEQREIHVTKRQILDAADSFVGEYNQIPPMYSALKVNGKKLYELARAGIEVERKARTVNIGSIHINAINLEEHTVTMTVECSKGTYIRTLCNDIGEKLGCGACMKQLTRTRVGDFSLDTSITLNQVQAKVLLGTLSEEIIAVDDLFAEYEQIRLKPEFDVLVHNGNGFLVQMLEDEKTPEEYADARYRVYDSADKFIGIYQYKEDIFTAVKMFYDGEEGVQA